MKEQNERDSAKSEKRIRGRQKEGMKYYLARQRRGSAVDDEHKAFSRLLEENLQPESWNELDWLSPLVIHLPRTDYE